MCNGHSEMQHSLYLFDHRTILVLTPINMPRNIFPKSSSRLTKDCKALYQPLCLRVPCLCTFPLPGWFHYSILLGFESCLSGLKSRYLLIFKGMPTFPLCLFLLPENIFSLLPTTGPLSLNLACYIATTCFSFFLCPLMVETFLCSVLIRGAQLMFVEWINCKQSFKNYSVLILLYFQHFPSPSVLYLS